MAGLMPGEIHQSELIWLVSPHDHCLLLSRRRAAMIINRVRLFAFLFAVLTPLWSIVDCLVFPTPLWFSLASIRVMASAAFALLVVYARPSGNMATAYRSIMALFLIPTLFFLASQKILAAYSLDGMSAAIGSGYAFLPFVLLAGLSIFPLTLLENLVLASPILLAQALSGLVQWTTLNWAPFAGAFWLLSLITAVATLAGISQLTFMAAIVQQSIRDPLTGAYSRSCGQEALELQFSLAQRAQIPLAVAFIDLDNFKSINDNYGHDAGDHALIGLADWIMSSMRRGDILCRWGGEEFLIVMPNTDLGQAVMAIRRIAGEGFGTRPDGSPLTASIGIAEFLDEGIDDWKRLVDKADHRMYLAKAAGRNRVVIREDLSQMFPIEETKVLAA